MSALQRRCRLRPRLLSSTDILWIPSARRLQLVAWPGVIVGISVGISVVSANIHETAIAPELASGGFGTVLGDRNYRSPRLTDELAGRKIDLVAPFKTAKSRLRSQDCQAQPQTARKRASLSFPLSDRDGIQPIGGSLPYQASGSEGQVASQKPSSLKGAQPNHRLYAEPSSEQSTSTNL